MAWVLVVEGGFAEESLKSFGSVHVIQDQFEVFYVDSYVFEVIWHPCPEWNIVFCRPLSIRRGLHEVPLENKMGDLIYHPIFLRVALNHFLPCLFHLFWEYFLKSVSACINGYSHQD